MMPSRAYLTFSLAFAALAGCKQDTSFLPESVDKVTIYSVEEVHDESKVPEDAEFFHRYLVLGKTEVTKDQGEAVLRAIRADIANGSEIDMCFWPHHGVRFETGDETLDIVICYYCRGYERTVDGKLTTTSYPIDVKSRGVLDALLRSKGVPLSKAATNEK